MTSNVILSHFFSFVSMAIAFPKSQKMCYTSPTTSAPVSPHTHTHTHTHTHSEEHTLCFLFPHLSLPSGLGDGGGVVYEAGRVWGEDSLHPQRRHPVPPPLWLGAGRGWGPTSWIMCHCLLVHDIVYNPLLLILCVERWNICQEEEREGPGEVC